MFKLNETYYTKSGYPARIICTDATFKNKNKACPIVALVTIPTNVVAQGQVCYFYTEDGKYIGLGSSSYDLVSNEPTNEEADLIRQINDVAEGSVSDKQEALLKIIRQLRQK